MTAGSFEYQDPTPSGSVKLRRAAIGGRAGSTARPSTPFPTYISLEECGTATEHLTLITCGALPVTVANTTGISFGSKQLMTFPKGKIHILSSNVEDYAWAFGNAGNVTPIDGTHGGDFALGSTATADGVINSTEVNILASTSYDPFSTAVSANSAINVILDGTTTAVSVYLNTIVDDSDVGNAASDILELTCTMWLKWYWMAG